jgi:arogenate dehydrogenase (NADP+), plant
MIHLEEAVEALPADRLAGKLVVDVSPLNQHPKSVLLKSFANHPDIDILVTNGEVPSSKAEAAAAASLWDGRPMVYERARVANIRRCDRYLNIFEKARCLVIEMNSEQHDATTADAEFVTHMIGRLLDRDLLPPTPVMSNEYKALAQVSEMASRDSFDLFFGMFKYNDRAQDHVTKMRDNLAALERQLAARDAYLSARDEMRNGDRQRLLAETRLLLQELAKSGIPGSNDVRGTIDGVGESGRHAELDGNEGSVEIS